jgi:hypothetical protein
MHQTLHNLHNLLRSNLHGQQHSLFNVLLWHMQHHNMYI